MLNFILDFIFPPKCLVCGANSKNLFCRICLDNISFIENMNDKIYSAVIYEGSVKKALNLFKFKKKINLASSLAEIMIKCAQKNKIIEKNNIECIIPVPIHKNKLKKREYNQAEILAQHIADFYKIKLNPNLLLKIKDTLEQNKLEKKERLYNLKSSFGVNEKESINADNILLIDDVYTTGATIKECIKALKRGRIGKRITVLTLARTVLW